MATHWYWIGAIPAMLFLALVMMPFYYISKTHSMPGYLKLRYGESTRALSAVSFAVMTVLMSGVNMFAMAKVMQVLLGWDFTFSQPSGGAHWCLLWGGCMCFSIGLEENQNPSLAALSKPQKQQRGSALPVDQTSGIPRSLEPSGDILALGA